MRRIFVYVRPRERGFGKSTVFGKNLVLHPNPHYCAHLRLGTTAMPRISSNEPLPCSKEQLQATDLGLVVIRPSIASSDQEPRFRCPVESCTYIGATLGHQGDCLRHLLDPKTVSVHNSILADNLVTFCNAEGKPLLNTRPSVQSAFSYQDYDVDKLLLAYMKVCT